MTNENRRPREDPRTATEAFDSAAPILDDLDAMAQHVDGVLVVVVERTEQQHYVRRCYLTAAAAGRALNNAVARSQRAAVYVAELRPIYRLGPTS